MTSSVRKPMKPSLMTRNSEHARGGRMWCNGHSDTGKSGQRPANQLMETTDILSWLLPHSELHYKEEVETGVREKWRWAICTLWFKGISSKTQASKLIIFLVNCAIRQNKKPNEGQKLDQNFRSSGHRLKSSNTSWLWCTCTSHTGRVKWVRTSHDVLHTRHIQSTLPHIILEYDSRCHGNGKKAHCAARNKSEANTS